MMSVEIFRYQVEQQGYEFQTLTSLGSGQSFQVLINRVQAKEHRFLESTLDSSSALWRNFANLEPTTEAIESFASSYGRLFLQEENNFVGNNPFQSNEEKPDDPIILVQNPYTKVSTVPFENIDSDQPLGVLAGEKFEAWKSNIHQMKRYCDLWDLIQEDNVNELKKHFIQRFETNDYRWQFVSRSEFYYTLGAPSEQQNRLETDFSIPINFPAELIKPTIKEVARHAILFKINEKLSDVRPQLLWDVTNPLSRHLDLKIVPKTLIDALWLHFAQAVARGTEYRQCEFDACKKWFALVNQNSEKKAYCDDACKQAAYRKRKAAKKSV